MECVAGLDVGERRGYAQTEELSAIRDVGHQLFIKLQAMRHSLNKVGDPLFVVGPWSPVS